MKTFIIKRMDGGITLGVLSPETPEEKLDEEIGKWAQSYPVKHDYYTLEDRLPDDDGYFHDAYDHNRELGCYVDMPKARIVHMNELRKLRQQKFIALGFPYRLNADVENAVVDAATKKLLQDLRDIPQTYDLSKAKDHKELRAMIPDLLK